MLPCMTFYKTIPWSSVVPVNVFELLFLVTLFSFRALCVMTDCRQRKCAAMH